ncbi:TIGR03915 family putative DNA repair protein [Desulfosporosinus sp. BICA1-9]|uniref:TIGR03915 family putative DNA repair protein n=1 Tax=Desulfosporosinus sp. BICA1-9 TaxID=1531958 RepID=UPI0005F1A345|nr:TIGR03915 family putative DNA repair protein [Desulfosporosinus sp. BICA1-9]KJS46387.1 MAG: DNA metabolism protein [Peptococcaceae bacterium BRH_c23]KJS86501.1 MAG: DNA metabolism protein [Desulfosporosinus sp. BICA1-9]HBW35595.1 DNA metabolism protein [Desulfosporosinus sp.]
MSDRTDLVYAYDGSFAGLMCCIFESYDQKENPNLIRPPGVQQSLFDTAKWIETDEHKADRVYNSIPLKISSQAQELVKLGFLTCNPRKELLIYHFLRLGFKHGSKVMTMLTNDAVCSLQKAVRHLTSESHKLTGFLRFSVYGEVLVAVIEPKNLVLPLLSAHFCDRFRNETFMIYDKTHSMALIYREQKAELMFVAELTLPEVEGSEIEYRRLWRQFYKTIAIEGRNNPRCRMTLMPKRYWGQMTEFNETDEQKSRGPDQWRVAETATETLPTSMVSLDSPFSYPTRK